MSDEYGSLFFFFLPCCVCTPEERDFTLSHLFLSLSFRNDGSIFDGLVEEDDKDKAKR